MFGELGIDDLNGATVLVVHAHPDDEVFATGAATIAARAAGARTHLRLFTGGEGRDSVLTPKGLASARRARETRLAESAELLRIDTWSYRPSPATGRTPRTHPPGRSARPTSPTSPLPSAPPSKHSTLTSSSPSDPTD